MEQKPSPQVEPKLDAAALSRFAEPIGNLIAETVRLKPGVRTSEFALLAAVLAAVFGLAFLDKLSGSTAALVSLAAAIIFQFARQSIKDAHRSAATGLTELLLDRAGEFAEVFRSLSTTNTTLEPKAGVSPGSIDAGPTSAPAVPSGQRGGVAGCAVPDVVFALGAAGAVILAVILVSTLTGCSLKGGTRLVESIGGRGSYTIDEFTGKPSGSGELIIKFRDGRDSKSVKPLGLRPAAIEAPTPGPLVVTQLPELAR